jgi:hypothetical protein
MSFKSDYTFLELSMEYRAIHSEIVSVQDQLRVVRQESLISYRLLSYRPAAKSMEDSSVIEKKQKLAAANAVKSESRPSTSGF